MSRPPDFILKSLNKATEHRTGKIGCAWKNEDGSLTLSLDIAVMPDPNGLLTLFPNDGGPARASSFGPSTSKKPRAKKGTMASLPASVVHRVGGRA